MVLRNSSQNFEFGGALVEAAICLPLLLILCMGAINISEVLDIHQRAKMIEYKALRASSALPGLTGKPHENPIIAQKIERLMAGQNIPETLYGIDSEYTGLQADNLVRFNIDLHAKTFFRFFGFSDHSVVETKGQSAYLFRGSFSYDYESYNVQDWPNYYGWNYGGGKGSVDQQWNDLVDQVNDIHGMHTIPTQSLVDIFAGH